MKRRYEDWNPSDEARAVVIQANEIVADYRAQGYSLTLRQLYYQFVARGFIPNNMRSYKRLGDFINRGRLAGLIDWSAIEDRTRSLAGGDGETSDPADVVRSFANYADVSRWDDQPTAVEIWVEKEALAGVIERVAQQWRVPYFSCRGYVSQSELWGAARRLQQHLRVGRNVLVLHLGDHDPSGIDMTRDITDRLNKFIAIDWLTEQMPGVSRASRFDIGMDIKDRIGERDGDVGLLGVEVRRIALNRDQIDRYQPPPNPAKLTDSRAQSYIEIHGDESWELDALDPATLNDLVTEHIEPVVDDERWTAKLDERDELREQYRRAADNWTEIQEQFA